MSIEIKCDRCGSPAEMIQEDSYSERSAKDSILFTRDGKAKVVDLCEKCRNDLDIFMGGKMPAPEYKTDELAYLELPNPSVCVYEKDLLTGLGRGSEIIISADLEPFNRLIDGYGITDLPLCAVKQVILGVELR